MANKFQTGFDQKKLVALYVDKPLGNAIEIVQTYSRVNRTCSGKDRVFVVDFVNDPETVLAAFKTYDKGATMSAAQDPNVVYDLKDALDAADVFATRDVEGFKEALYRSKGLAAGGESDAYRTALYSAVSGPPRSSARGSRRPGTPTRLGWSAPTGRRRPARPRRRRGPRGARTRRRDASRS